MDQIIIVGNTFEQCGVGAALWPAGGNGGGSTGLIANNTFVRCNRPVDIRNVRGVSVSDNVIIDWGYVYNQDGSVTLDPEQYAVNLQGVIDSTFANNTFSLRDWAKSAHLAFYVNRYTFETTTFEATGNVFSGGKISDAALAFNINALATGCSVSGVNLTNVTSIISDASNSAVWRVVKDGVERWGKGNTDYNGTWTPTITLSGLSPTGTYIIQSGAYTRAGDQVTLHFRVQINSFTFTGGSSSNELRITGLPFTPSSAIATGYQGSLGLASGVTWPTGTVGTVLEIFTSGTTIHITAMGTSTRSINATDLVSGGGVRIDGTIAYKAA